MTDKKKFKARVRHRMERTGESYATARAHLNEPYSHKIWDEIMAMAGDHVPTTDAEWLAQFDWVDRNPDARPLRDFDWVHGIGYVMLDADGNPTKVSPFVKLKADNPDFYALIGGQFPIGRLSSPLSLAHHKEVRETWVSALFPDGYEDSMGGSAPTEKRYTDVDEFFLAIEDAKAANHETCSYDDPRSRSIGFIDVTACAYHCIGLSHLKAGITDANRDFFLGADGRAAYFGHGGPEGDHNYYAYQSAIDKAMDLSMGELIWDIFEKKMSDQELGELMVSLWIDAIPELEKLGDMTREVECLDDVLGQ